MPTSPESDPLTVPASREQPTLFVPIVGVLPEVAPALVRPYFTAAERARRFRDTTSGTHTRDGGPPTGGATPTTGKENGSKWKHSTMD
ncbi:hypothetical protein F4559_003516 [Saccharothrix violaceirubra]|uniref:Uncharacterized protein n=1 Tax=Saccharothrix violaceirubra TaxID=413306 RepID=A0A7W7T421_9PSEU|nr:hypothetical protein [Saccharothrix violaceirubra]